MDIQPIPTQYKGHLFRSRLEARWAVFLDTLGQTWEYEKEGYALKSGRYLPDFWLPSWDMWLECKGDEPTDSAKELCRELAEGTDKVVMLCHSFCCIQVYIGDFTDSSGGVGWWDCSWAEVKEDLSIRVLCLAAQGAGQRDRDFVTPASWTAWANMRPEHFTRSSIAVQEAYRQAKQSRFEYGSSGGIKGLWRGW